MCPPFPSPLATAIRSTFCPRFTPSPALLQARALASLGGEGDSENVAFLIGTQSLRAPNQVHLLSFDEEEDR